MCIKRKTKARKKEPPAKLDSIIYNFYITATKEKKNNMLVQIKLYWLLTRMAHYHWLLENTRETKPLVAKKKNNKKTQKRQSSGVI